LRKASERACAKGGGAKTAEVRHIDGLIVNLERKHNDGGS